MLNNKNKVQYKNTKPKTESHTHYNFMEAITNLPPNPTQNLMGGLFASSRREREREYPSLSLSPWELKGVRG